MRTTRDDLENIDVDEGMSEPDLYREGQKAAAFSRTHVFCKAENFILGELHNPNLSSQRIAHSIGVSRAVLYRAFTHAGGVKKFVDGKRLATAFKTLQIRCNEPGIVASAARSCGYESKIRFSRLFLARYRETPTSFVRRMRQGGTERG